MRQKKYQPPIERVYFTCGEVRTVPHKQPQPAKLRYAPDGVCEGVGCARQQSSAAARNDLRGVLRTHSCESAAQCRKIAYVVILISRAGS